ncbi:MAG TPA: sigma-70 factor domain-containing protein, partial [Thermomicrobiales bacterium]|nr:sigma-70 factor domain-containing protein [Thermomicrobiales bacterium]
MTGPIPVLDDLSCEHVSTLLPFLVNGTLSEGAAARMSEHVLRCASCRREHRDWKSIAEAANTLPAPAVPRQVPHQVWDTLDWSVADEATVGATPETAPPAEGSISREAILEARSAAADEPIDFAALSLRLRELEEVIGGVADREEEAAASPLGLESPNYDIGAGSLDDPVRMYLREIGRVPLLSAARE